MSFDKSRFPAPDRANMQVANGGPPEELITSNAGLTCREQSPKTVALNFDLVPKFDLFPGLVADGTSEFPLYRVSGRNR